MAHVVSNKAHKKERTMAHLDTLGMFEFPKGLIISQRDRPEHQFARTGGRSATSRLEDTTAYSRHSQH